MSAISQDKDALVHSANKGRRPPHPWVRTICCVQNALREDNIPEMAMFFAGAIPDRFLRWAVESVTRHAIKDDVRLDLRLMLLNEVSKLLRFCPVMEVTMDFTARFMEQLLSSPRIEFVDKLTIRVARWAGLVVREQSSTLEKFFWILDWLLMGARIKRQFAAGRRSFKLMLLLTATFLEKCTVSHAISVAYTWTRKVLQVLSVSMSRIKPDEYLGLLIGDILRSAHVNGVDLEE